MVPISELPDPTSPTYPEDVKLFTHSPWPEWAQLWQSAVITNTAQHEYGTVCTYYL